MVMDMRVRLEPVPEGCVYLVVAHPPDEDRLDGDGLGDARVLGVFPGCENALFALYELSRPRGCDIKPGHAYAVVRARSDDAVYTAPRRIASWVRGEVDEHPGCASGRLRIHARHSCCL